MPVDRSRGRTEFSPQPKLRYPRREVAVQIQKHIGILPVRQARSFAQRNSNEPKFAEPKVRRDSQVARPLDNPGASPVRLANSRRNGGRESSNALP